MAVLVMKFKYSVQEDLLADIITYSFTVLVTVLANKPSRI